MVPKPARCCWRDAARGKALGAGMALKAGGICQAADFQTPVIAISSSKTKSHRAWMKGGGKLE